MGAESAPVAGRAAARAPTTAGYRRWLLFVLLLVCCINYADRSVVGAVAEPLRREFGLSDLQLGILSGFSFAVLYSVLGIPLARLAERASRIRIITAATLLWSLMTALCGAAAGYGQLLCLRVGVGVGEAGFMAPATSLLGDHFRAHERALATSIMMLGVPFGALIGALSGGVIAQSLGWRWAFVITGIPGILIGCLVFATLREPVRGSAEEPAGAAPPAAGPTAGAPMAPAVTAPMALMATAPTAPTAPAAPTPAAMPGIPAEAPPLATVARQCFSNPTFRHVVMGGTLGGFGLHGLGQFLGVYFTRVHALSYAAAGALYGAQTFASVAGGLLLGGLLVNRLGRRNPRWYSLIPAIGMFGSVPLYLAGFSASSLPVSVGLIVAAGISLLLHYGPGFALVQNLAAPRTRASYVALYMVFVNAVAMGLAAPLIGLASDWFAGLAARGLGGTLCVAAAACPRARSAGLQYALMASTLFYAWGGVHYLLAQRTRTVPTGGL